MNSWPARMVAERISCRFRRIFCDSCTLWRTYLIPFGSETAVGLVSRRIFEAFSSSFTNSLTFVALDASATTTKAPTGSACSHSSDVVSYTPSFQRQNLHSFTFLNAKAMTGAQLTRLTGPGIESVPNTTSAPESYNLAKAFPARIG